MSVGSRTVALPSTFTHRNLLTLDHGVLLAFQLLHLSLESSNDLLALIGPFGQLFLDLLVKRYVSLKYFNLLSHLIMSFDELLGILRLIVQLRRQLMVLENGQSCLSLKLFIVEGHQVRLSLFDFEVHLLSQLFHILDFLKLSFIDLYHAFLLLGLVLDLKCRDSIQNPVFLGRQVSFVDNPGI